MRNYRTLLDPGLFIGPQDLPEPKTVTISRAVREAIPGRDGEKGDSSPMLYFSYQGKELPRKYKVPKSVLFGLSLLLGPDIDAWPGKSIVLFATRCMSFGEVEDCIRVQFPADIDGKVRKWMKKRKASLSAYMMPNEAAPERKPAKVQPFGDSEQLPAKAPAKPTDTARQPAWELLRIAEECEKGLGHRLIAHMCRQLRGAPVDIDAVPVDEVPAMLVAVEQCMQVLNQATTEAGDSGQETREATHAAIVAMIGGK
jgi:hypothetical protein